MARLMARHHGHELREAFPGTQPYPRQQGAKRQTGQSCGRGSRIAETCELGESCPERGPEERPAIDDN